jgi:hypothetical protein
LIPGLRPFCDTVRIEIGAATLDFLNPISTGGSSKSAKVDFAKFEALVVDAVKSIDRNGQPLCGHVAAKPDLSRLPSVPERFRSKITKSCRIKLKDVCHSSKHRKLFQRARNRFYEITLYYGRKVFGQFFPSSNSDKIET